MRFSIYH